MIINNLQKNKGFTLVELMVATSIFVVVMLASMSALFILLDSGKSSRALRLAMDNVNFAVESMTRSIRMGTNYYCVTGGGNGIGPTDFLNTGKNCSNGGTAVSFLPQGSTTSRVGYEWHIDSNNKGTLLRCDANGCVSIVSSDVNIEQLKFFVKGSEVNDGQASTYIIIKGTVYVKNVPTSFSIQTLASQRNF